ncbi:MAG: HAD family hydrolase [Arenibacterium sp.]
MRIAMWSGPRNLSTAMMYAFGNRQDFAVVDEPFYAAYLTRTGLDHPMREAIIASQPTDPDQVAQTLVGPIPGGKTHFYQKHMTQHMIEGMPTKWMASARQVFLLRHPARVIASFAAKYPNLTLADIGFVEQTRLYDAAIAQGQNPIVIDSFDIRQNPKQMLTRLCHALGLEFDPAMLQWPKGGHPADGVWAAHWYDAVHRSTGFAGPEGDFPELNGPLNDLQQQALPHYEKLYDSRLR